MENEKIVERLIGKYIGNKPGKLFVVIAGIHGNEKTGLDALQRVFNRLELERPDFCGAIVGIAGNLKAIEENTRYLEVDLNRIWTEEHIIKITKTSLPGLEINEHKEMKSLLLEIDKVTKGISKEDIVFIDLHNTSANEGMFTFTFEGKENYRIASSLHIPIITGLDNSLKGTAIEYFDRLGYNSIAFEGGPLGFEKSIDIHEAGIWLLLESCGCIGNAAIPNYSIQKSLMIECAGGFPEVSELIYVHNIKQEDEFKMNNGYSNFQKVKKGELLGRDIEGDVLAPHTGYLMMPLYQKQGKEGFFITKEV